MKDSQIKKVLLQGPTKNGMYVFPQPSPPPRAYASERVSPLQWHIRLGHQSMQLIHRIVSQVSLPVKSSTSFGLCSSCCKAKLHQLPYGRSSSQSTTLLQLLFSNIWGPPPVLSRGGFSYYLSFVDDYSQFTWSFPLKFKYDVVTVFSLLNVM